MRAPGACTVAGGETAGMVEAGASRAMDPSLYQAMRWRDIGPYRGGRVLAVEGVSGVPGLFYFGAAAGGVWKSEDNGSHWRPVFDQVGESSIGAIAVAPSNPKIIYVGTGEGALRNSSASGSGVYQSTDSGETWIHVGLSDTRHIAGVVVDPRNPDVVMVAAIGHAYGPNAERGVFRSENGGKNWKKVLFRDENSGAADIAYNPHDPDIVYASLWQVRQQPWGDSSRGPGGGLFRSPDGGKSWAELKGNGLPAGPLGRIGIAISRADPRRVYALIEAKEGGLYRSDDDGAHWARFSDDARICNRPLYYGKIHADPISADTIYVPNTALYRSTDGGKSFHPIQGRGYDYHAVWIDPADPRRIITASDTGASVSLDSGQTWSPYDNQPIGQIYHVAADNRFPYWVYGTQQDFGGIAVVSDSNEGPINARSWYSAGSGEAGFMAPDPRDAMIVYSASSGQVARFDKRKEQLQDISPWPLPSISTGRPAHRFNWNAPVMLSPHDPDLLYAAGEVVWKSADQGHSWTIVSPDLTCGEKSKEGTGIPFSFGTISTFAESPVKKGMLWAGSDDGRVHLTRDGGAHWTDVTPSVMQDGGMVSTIEPSPFDPEVAYLAVERHQLDDVRPYAFKTSDGGTSWTLIKGGLPEGAFVRAVREDPKRRGLLYAATERGMFISFDDGAHWKPLQLNLPATPVHDLVVKDDDLVVATHGRGFWILDNLTPLRQLTPSTQSRDVVLFAPPAAFRVNNRGATIDYMLRNKPNGEIILDILDGKGKLVRHLSSIEKPKNERASFYASASSSGDKISADVGINRVLWNLRCDDPVEVPGATYSDGWLFRAARGVRVAPGNYTLRLTVDGNSFEQPLTLLPDPRLGSADAAINARVALETVVANDIDRLHEAIEAVGKLRETARKEPLASKLARLASEMRKIDETLLAVNTKARAWALAFPTNLEADTPPTEQERTMVDDLHRWVEAALASLKTMR